MRTKLTYSVTKKEDWELEEGENKITGHYADIEVYGKNETEAKENFNSFEEYLNNNSSYQVSSCPSIEEVKTNVWCYYESIYVFDKEEFEEVKEIYKEWKASLKAEKVESSNSNTPVVAKESKTPISEKPTQVTSNEITCNNIQENTNTPSYRIYQSTINLKGTTLQVGQKYRLDLLNGTNINEVTELTNLIWNEFTTGHKDGNDTIMYIEITGQKAIVTNSQLCNSNNLNLQDENKNVYIDSDNELVIERINSTYGKIYNELHSRVKHIKQALENDLNNNFITQTEYNQCIALL